MHLPQTRPRRSRLPGQRVVANPDQDGILRILWHVGRPLRASELFGRVERCVPGPAFHDVSSLAAEAMQLERRGFVRHAVDDRGLVVVSLTARGRRFIALRYGAYKRPVAASLIAPVVAACTSAPTSHTAEQRPLTVAELAQLPSKPGSVVDYSGVGAARQVMVNGKKTWLWCTSNDCVYPTAKEEVKPVAAAHAPVLASHATPVAAAPIASAHQSVFFGFASASVDRSDVTALREVARGVPRSARITVTGLTDPSGSPELNARLAKQRAAAVRALLVKEGFEEQNITVTTDLNGTRKPPQQQRATASAAAKGDAALRRADVQFEFERGQGAASAAGQAAKPELVAISAPAAPAFLARKSLQACTLEKTDFKLPPSTRPEMHVARFEVLVNAGGTQVARATMTSSSGVSGFDAAVAKAVERCLAAGAAAQVTSSAALRVEVDLFDLSLRQRIAAGELPASEDRPGR